MDDDQLAKIAKSERSKISGIPERPSKRCDARIGHQRHRKISTMDKIRDIVPQKEEEYRTRSRGDAASARIDRTKAIREKKKKRAKRIGKHRCSIIEELPELEQTAA